MNSKMKKVSKFSIYDSNFHSFNLNISIKKEHIEFLKSLLWNLEFNMSKVRNVKFESFILFESNKI